MLWEHVVIILLTMLGGFVFIANTALGRICLQLLTEFVDVSTKEEEYTNLHNVHTETISTRLILVIITIFNLYLLYTIMGGLSDDLKVIGAIANTFAVKKLFDFEESYKTVTQILHQYIKP